MVEINLLPWRQLAQKQQQRRLLWIFLISMGLIIIFLVFLHMIIAHVLLKDKLSLEKMRAEVINLSSQSKMASDLDQQYQRLVDFSDLIRQVELSHAATLKLLQRLRVVTPSDVTIKLLSRKKNQIILQGSSRTVFALALFIKNLNAEKYLKNPLLIDMKSQKKDEQLNFQLKVTQNDESFHAD